MFDIIHIIFSVYNLFTGKSNMSNWDTRSQTVKNEIKTEILDHVIKEEIKTEIEEIPRKSHGFICPTCESYFLYEDNFIEHVRQIHSDTSITSGEQIYIIIMNHSDLQNHK